MLLAFVPFGEDKPVFREATFDSLQVEGPKDEELRMIFDGMFDPNSTSEKPAKAAVFGQPRDVPFVKGN